MKGGFSLSGDNSYPFVLYPREHESQVHRLYVLPNGVCWPSPDTNRGWHFSILLEGIQGAYLNLCVIFTYTCSLALSGKYYSCKGIRKAIFISWENTPGLVQMGSQLKITEIWKEKFKNTCQSAFSVQSFRDAVVNMQNCLQMQVPFVERTTNRLCT